MHQLLADVLSLLALLVQKFTCFTRAKVLALLSSQPRAVYQLLAEEVSKSKYFSTSKASTLVLVKQVHELLLLALLALKYLLLLPFSRRSRKASSAAANSFLFSPHFFLFLYIFFLHTCLRKSRKAANAAR